MSQDASRCFWLHGTETLTQNALNSGFQSVVLRPASVCITGNVYRNVNFWLCLLNQKHQGCGPAICDLTAMLLLLKFDNMKQ